MDEVEPHEEPTSKSTDETPLETHYEQSAEDDTQQSGEPDLEKLVAEERTHEVAHEPIIQEPLDVENLPHETEEHPVDEPGPESAKDVVYQDEEHREHTSEEAVEQESSPAEPIHHESLEQGDEQPAETAETSNEEDQVTPLKDLEKIPQTPVAVPPEEHSGAEEEPAVESTTHQGDETAAEKSVKEHEQPSITDVDKTNNVPEINHLDEPAKENISSEVGQDEIGESQTEEMSKIHSSEDTHEAAEIHETTPPEGSSEDVAVTDSLEEQHTVERTNRGAPFDEHLQDEEIPEAPADELTVQTEPTSPVIEKEVIDESEQQSEHKELTMEVPPPGFVAKDKVADAVESEVEHASVEDDVHNKTEESTPQVTVDTAPLEEDLDSGDKEESTEQATPVDASDEHMVDQHPPNEEESPHVKTNNVDTTSARDSPPEDDLTNDKVMDGTPTHALDVEESPALDERVEDVAEADTNVPKSEDVEIVSEEPVQEAENDEATGKDASPNEVSRESATEKADKMDDIPMAETTVKDGSAAEERASENTEEHNIMPEIAVVVGGVGLAAAAVAESHEADYSVAKEPGFEDVQKEAVPELPHEFAPQTSVESEKKRDESHETPNLDDKIADEPEVVQEQTAVATETPEHVVDNVLTESDSFKHQESSELKEEVNDPHPETAQVPPEPVSVESVEQDSAHGKKNP